MTENACTKDIGQQSVREVYDCTQQAFQHVMSDPAGATLSQWGTVVALLGAGLFIAYIVISVAVTEARR